MIDDYHQFLKGDIREEAVAYYTGIWYYFQDKLDEALHFLTKNESISQFSYKTKIFVVRILFEKFLEDDSYYQVLSSSLISFNAFAKRNDYFSGKKLISHLNFVKLIRKTVDKLLKQEEKEIIKNWLTKECNSGKPIYAKKWLLGTIKKFKDP